MDYKWHGILIAVSLMLLISSATGCITVVRAPAPTPAPQEPTAPPVINSFTASPMTISSAQQTTLSWDVSDAKTVTIEPGIGAVGPSGSLQLSPPANVTYTLTATNQAGSSNISVTVTVTPAGKPDLVITDVWLSGETVFYKIKNQGDVDAKSSRSELYVTEMKETDTYAEPLAAGQEKTDSFSNWIWRYQPPSGIAVSPETPQHRIKVCADAENTVDEFDESNNCITTIIGATVSYDFVRKAHQAKWRSSAGDLKWPMVSGDRKGAASTMTDTIVMCPEQVSNGWISGRFADYYTEEGGVTLSRELTVPQSARFTAKVGFGPGPASADGVRVAFGYLDAVGGVVLLQKMDVYSDGALHPYEVDLSDMAGKKTEFILWVEAKDSPEEDCIRWVEPRIVQK